MKGRGGSLGVGGVHRGPDQYRVGTEVFVERSIQGKNGEKKKRR